MSVRDRKYRAELGPRDFQVLISLWRWKLATTATIALEHFGKAESDYAYRRMGRLSRHGLVLLRSVDELRGHAWILTPKGFQLIREQLPTLKQLGFRSEAPHHDLLCAALQRGDSLHMKRPDVEHVTEQELRCVSPEALPAWVPQSELHRPDGYSKVLLSGKPSIVAFEVENNLKKETDYHAPVAMYGSLESIFRIIWVVRDRTDLLRFEKLLRRLDSKTSDIHLLVSRVDFLVKLWDAPIVSGIEAGQTLSYFLRRDVSLDRSRAGLVRDRFPVLNFQKRPFISSFYDRRQRNSVPNRTDNPVIATAPAISSDSILPAQTIPRSSQLQPSKGNHDE